MRPKGGCKPSPPPGVEPHSFEPKPGDVMRINKADIFIYTGDFMEPWAAAIIKGALRRDLVVVDSSRGVRLRQESEHRGARPGSGHGRKARRAASRP